MNVLCQLVARAAGSSVEAFANEYLFGPLGVSNHRFTHHSTGMALCHGDIYLTPGDLAEFGHLFLNGGVWDGERILSEEWVKKSWAPLISVRDLHLGFAEDFGYLWWLREYTVAGETFSAFKAVGWGGQEVWVIPDEDLVVAFTGANCFGHPPCEELMTGFILPALGS